jgi:hypothetical protein
MSDLRERLLAGYEDLNNPTRYWTFDDGLRVSRLLQEAAAALPQDRLPEGEVNTAGELRKLGRKASEYGAHAVYNALNDAATTVEALEMRCVQLADAFDAERAQWDEERDRLDAELEREMNAKDAAYLERNRLVALLSKLFPSGYKKTAIEGWDPAWDNCVFIDLPTGQCSWHFHDREELLFAHLPTYTKEWDGRTTEQKYARVAAYVMSAERRSTRDSLPVPPMRVKHSSYCRCTECQAPTTNEA